MDLIKKAELFAKKHHDATGCTYHNQNFAIHLDDVKDALEELLAKDGELYYSSTELEIMKTGVWLHDTIEDCRVNYNELAEKFNLQVAEVVYKVTNELGKNRAERATKTYPKIASCRLARLVKLADRIANTRYSIKTQSSMFEKYKEEYSKFKKIVKPRFINQFPDSPESLGWRTLDQLYYGSQPCKEEEVSVG